MQFPALSINSIYAPTAPAIPASVAWTNSLGHALIRNVTVDIGGQQIDKHYGQWLEIWDKICSSEYFLKENASNLIGVY